MKLTQVVDTLLKNNARMAVAYLSEKEVIRATRVCLKGRLPRKGTNVEIVLTLGRPNYAERAFIRQCKTSREPFPIKKVQLKFPKH